MTAMPRLACRYMQYHFRVDAMADREISLVQEAQIDHIRVALAPI